MILHWPGVVALTKDNTQTDNLKMILAVVGIIGIGVTSVDWVHDTIDKKMSAHDGRPHAEAVTRQEHTRDIARIEAKIDKLLSGKCGP